MSKLNAIDEERAKLNEQLAELERREAAILEEERPAAITRINADIARYKIKAQDLRFESEGHGTPKQSKVPTKKQQAPAKYKNPNGDETWSGRGTPPKWMPKDKTEWDKLGVSKA
ncbi:H-NS histone family protein [Burkholderia sp. 9120]|uniref:H-NS histone family protein n=1 Tax=Burkholderia sp. 9120 TaxID=1500897 RepID=UPI000554952A|nr:H-NS histone family protein [Burkholderia sp. 9120]